MGLILFEICLHSMEDANALTLDLGELRKEIGTIKGVGEKRLDEIMAVIERHLGI